MGKYQEVISLGFSCMVAQDLEKWGRRNSSYPFDWVISNFQDVINIIEKDFSECLLEVRQDEEHDNVYNDVKTGLAYYHDFFPDKSIEQQIGEVRKKYERRICRFKEKAKEPTLFLRFVRNETDLAYIEDNLERIEKALKSFNEENECVYILTKTLAEKTKLQNVFITSESNHPVLKCEKLKTFIRKNLLLSRVKITKNKIRYLEKALKKRFGRK